MKSWVTKPMMPSASAGASASGTAATAGAVARSSIGAGGADGVSADLLLNLSVVSHHGAGRVLEAPVFENVHLLRSLLEQKTCRVLASQSFYLNSPNSFAAGLGFGVLSTRDPHGDPPADSQDVAPCPHIGSPNAS